MKLNIKTIKDKLIEALISDKRIVKLLGHEDDDFKAQKLMNDKIFTYFKTSSFSLNSFIYVDVEEYESSYKVLIKVECHEDLSNNEDSCSYNKADMLSDYVKENIATVFPKANDYKNVPHCSSSYIIRDISFRLDNEEEGALI